MTDIVSYLMPRFNRRRGRRSGGMRLGNVIQSYKKVLNFAPISHAAAAVVQDVIVTGVDSAAMGQTGVTDPNVPTGSVIKFIEIQYSANNLVNTSSFLHLAVQYTNAGQTPLSPNVVGGNPQRNQVFWQMLISLGLNQNQNRVIKFKIPPKYQRIREGTSWFVSQTGTAIWTKAIQVIYKAYR